MSNRIKVTKPNPAAPISYVTEDCMDNLAHINSKLRPDQKWQLELVEYDEATQKEVGLIRIIERSPTIQGKTEVIERNKQIHALSDENYKLQQEIAELRRMQNSKPVQLTSTSDSTIPNQNPVTAFEIKSKPGPKPKLQTV